MGKLTELIKFRNDLQCQRHSFSLSTDIQNNINLIDKLFTSYDHLNNLTNIDDFKNNCIKLLNENQKALINTNNTIDDIINTLTQSIDDYALTLFSDEKYRKMFSEESVWHTLFLPISAEVWVESRIVHYSNWRFPALQIFPRSKKWIDLMVAGDPLYLTHTNINIVKSMIIDYPALYQSRLRLYEVKNRIFSELPQEQFGFVLCWDLFNHLSDEKIEQYLKQVFSLLRPGGYFLFSYTNCDLFELAHKAECSDGNYTTARWLTKLLNNIGYEIIEMIDFKTNDAFQNYISCAEVKKPGQLTTVKLHQALATIHNK